jgi:thiamine kinase-like enzyme
VLRLAGAGISEYIDRAAEAHNARIAAAAGVNAQVLHFEITDGTMLARYIDDCLTMSEAAFKNLARVERAAHAFRRMHRFTQPFAGRFDVFVQIDGYLALLRRNDARISDGYEALQKEVDAARRVLSERPAALAPCHNDPLAENFLDARGRMCLATGNMPA